MVDILERRRADGQLTLIRDLGLHWRDAALIMGEGSGELADAYRRAGALELGYQGDEFVLLGSSEPSHLHPTPLDTGLTDRSIDLVVLRHVVEEQSALSDVLDEVYRILRPGGGVLVSDVNVGAMLDGGFHGYPVRVLYDMFPEALEGEVRRHIDSADLDIETVRAGFKDVISYDVGEVRAVLETPEEFLAYVEHGGWRSVDLLDDEEREALVASLRRSPFLAGDPITDREAWHVVRGFKPIV